MKTIISIIIILLFTSCTQQTYKPQEVKIVSEGLVTEGVKLTFKPKAETMYFCGGVNYKQSNEKIHFEFNRTKINETVMCKLKASTDQNGNLYVIFPFPDKQKSIELIDSSGKSLGSWTKN